MLVLEILMFCTIRLSGRPHKQNLSIVLFIRIVIFQLCEKSIRAGTQLDRPPGRSYNWCELFTNLIIVIK